MYVGEKVRLRAYRESDAERATELFSNPELMEYLQDYGFFPYSLADEKSFIAAQSANTSGEYNFAIETLDGNLYIGGCGINQWDALNRCATIGIAVADPDYWGHGYGTDAMRVLMRFLFVYRAAHRVELCVFSFNERAIASYIKCGFRQEGVLREQVFHNGRYYDSHLMGVLREEWDALQNKEKEREQEG